MARSLDREIDSNAGLGAIAIENESGTALLVLVRTIFEPYARPMSSGTGSTPADLHTMCAAGITLTPMRAETIEAKLICGAAGKPFAEPRHDGTL